MKRFLASILLGGLLVLGFSNAVTAQEESSSTQTEMTSMVPMSENETSGGFHQALKTKFIEGGPEFMSAITVVLILGLGICLERIIYLNLADANNDKLLSEIHERLQKNDVAGAIEVARDTRGPVASIAYQALTRIDQGVDVVERSITAYGGVQAGLLEKNMSWITLFIAIAPSLGFLGTVIGMVMAFDTIEQVGDISPTVVAGGMKVALITTIFGLIVAMILQIFYNYILAKYEAILNKMEDASITLVDFVVEHSVKYQNK